jgi:hypothetical protein
VIVVVVSRHAGDLEVHPREEWELLGNDCETAVFSQGEQQCRHFEDDGKISWRDRVRSLGDEGDHEAQREKELMERTGSSSVPQVFFNEKLFEGLVALHSLRNINGFDQRLKEMLGKGFLSLPKGFLRPPKSK